MNPPLFAALIDAGRRLDGRGWAPATSGNLSARLNARTAMVTASGTHKGRLGADDFLRVDIATGDLVDPEGSRDPSAETMLHLLVYRRTEAQAVLHAHSPAAVALSRRLRGDAVRLAGYELLKAFDGIATHEAVLEVPVFDNEQDMASLAGRIEARLPVLDGYGFVLRSHGVYAWGRDVDGALRHLEALEALFEYELRA